MAYFQRLIICVFLVFSSGAMALDMVSTQPTGNCTPEYHPASYKQDPAVSATWVCGWEGRSPQNCGWSYVAGAYGWDGSTANGVYSGMCNMPPPVLSCPANSTADGSGGCTCSAGYYEANGQCESATSDKAICDTWSALNGTLGGLFTLDSQRFTGSIADGAVFCSPVEGLSSPNKGCKMAFEWTASYGYGDTKVTEGKFVAVPNTSTVDSSCTPGDSNSPPTLPPTQETCKDGYTGQVNGVNVCVSVRPDSGVGSTTTTTSTNNGTETQAVTTQNQTQCANGVCTTTTTTTTTTTNNSTGSSTTNTTTSDTSESQDGFCKENADSKLCSDGTEDGSSFTGSCTTEFVCEGDAIQCAIAREQHKRACKMFDDESPESKLYEDNKGKEGNQTGDLPDNETISLTGRINSSDALGAGSAGVSDLQVTVWGQSISLPFSQINPYLAHLGNVLLAVSFLIAVRIVARG